MTAALLATLLSLTGASLAALDWPQYLGEGRDGVYKGPPLVAQAAQAVRDRPR